MKKLLVLLYDLKCAKARVNVVPDFFSAMSLILSITKNVYELHFFFISKCSTHTLKTNKLNKKQLKIQ